MAWLIVLIAGDSCTISNAVLWGTPYLGVSVFGLRSLDTHNAAIACSSNKKFLLKN